MADYLSRGLEAYHEWKRTTADPRVQDWKLMKDPVVPFLAIVAYGVFVRFGPVWMANRKPFEIKKVVVAYNFFMVLLSAYTVKEFLLGGWLFDYSLGCQPVDYSNSPTALRMAGAVWLFFVAKYIELLDTIFFILRKKDNQVTVLHVFHHGVLPMFWWWGLQVVPGGFGTFHALVNAFVHVVMYFYYGVAALGPKYQKYLWWKRYVTVLQLSQFFIVTIHNAQLLFIRCDTYPWIFAAFIQGFTTIVAVLFLNFYIKTYRRKGQGKQPQPDSKSNGHVLQNGIQNGAAVANGSTPKVNGGHRYKFD